MSPLTPKGDLSAAQVAFFAPALLIGLVVVLRHGFSRQAGWVYIVILSILRIIGAGCTLYINTQHDYSTSLLTAAAITSAIGTAPLLLALLGFLQRVNDHMSAKNIPTVPFRAVSLVSLAALIVAIVGGVKESHSNPSSIQTGRNLLSIASVLWLAMLLILAAATTFTFFYRSHVLPAERKLVYVGLASLPFLLVRIIYTVIVAFAHPGSDFYFSNTNIRAEAFMQFLMETIVITLFIVAGLLTPKVESITTGTALQGQKDADVRFGSDPESATGLEAGNNPYNSSAQHYQEQQHYRESRPQKSLADYRPSRMIRNALRGN